VKHSETLKIVFLKTEALLCYLALLAHLLLSQNLQRCKIFPFLKINNKKRQKDLAHFIYLCLIIVRYPKVVTLVYSPQLTKSLTFSKSGPSSCCDYFCQLNFLKHNLILEILFFKDKHLRDVLAKVSLEKVFKSCRYFSNPICILIETLKSTRVEGKYWGCCLRRI
jgi:hypothetical protein